MPRIYLLGMDQGSTKTIAIVARQDGEILGKGVSFGTWHASMDTAPETHICRETGSPPDLRLGARSRPIITGK